MPVGGADIDAEPHDDPRESAPSVGKSPTKVSPFAPKASRITRALLSQPTEIWRLSDLAQRVRMNPGNVHRVLTALTAMGLVERDGDGYAVQDPGSLLEAWAENDRTSRAAERISMQVRDDLGREIERVVHSLEGHAVVSGEWAAEHYAPYLSASHAIVHCIDSGVWDPEGLAARLGPPPLRASNRVTIDLADEGVADFSQDRNGLPLVAPQQLYVDLYRDRTRAREAAEHVRQEVLRF
jgi:hypothetical protein